MRECVCFHDEDEHSTGFLGECEAEGCECPFFEEYEDDLS